MDGNRIENENGRTYIGRTDADSIVLDDVLVSLFGLLIRVTNGMANVKTHLHDFHGLDQGNEANVQTNVMDIKGNIVLRPDLAIPILDIGVGRKEEIGTAEIL